MRRVLSPLKKARKKNRKKIDRTKLRFQPSTAEKAIEESTVAEVLEATKRVIIPPEPPKVEKRGETDGVEKVPLPSSPKSPKPKPSDN